MNTQFVYSVVLTSFRKLWQTFDLKIVKLLLILIGIDKTQNFAFA